jgi:hypothetical protein
MQQTLGPCGCASKTPDSQPSEGDEDDPALEQDGLGEADPYGDVLHTKDGLVDLDDAAAADLDIGVLLTDLEEVDQAADAHELVLDISALLKDTEERSSQDALDEEGPVGAEAFYGLEELPSDAEPGAADGLLESSTELCEQDLPALDGDGDDGVGVLDLAAVGDAALDEPLPEWTANRWDSRAVEPALPACSVLALTGEWIAAAGNGIYWLDRGCAVKRQLSGLGAGVVAAAARAPEWDSVRMATAEAPAWASRVGAGWLVFDPARP